MSSENRSREKSCGVNVNGEQLAGDCWFGALAEGARRLSVFCSDALSQWEQCFLTIFFSSS